ncbi:HDOD domain-containing protein [Thiomicrorhabdus aquaedulcis]|uniref:HDOD domain-containing protein n=1 Tax=Thiomicrorhabdus aquaedulcis TaxID=2211106 RepID=UPI001561E007|nr:HDOD domain-containing protein [Thiomicrorhabdus aquaedulcis]
MPESLIRLKKLTAKKMIHSFEVIEILESNSLIAGEFLHAVNSGSFYDKPKEELSSIKASVDFLGTNNKVIISIVTAIEFKNSISFEKESQADANEIIDNCKDIAYLCAELSEQVYGIDKDEAYLFGLFADSGYLLLLSKNPFYSKIYRQSLTDPVKTLHAEIRYGADHACTSYIMARAWDLPMWLKAGLLYHENGKGEVTINLSRRVEDLVSLYKVANFMVSEISYGSYITERFKSIYKAGIEELGLDNDSLSMARNAFIVDSISKQC